MSALALTSPAPAGNLTLLPPPAECPWYATEADSLAWSQVPPAGQAECSKWLADMLEIQAAGKGARGKVVARVATRRGLTASAVRTKYDRWLNEGWKALINRAKNPAPRCLPQATIEFYRSLCHAHQRRKGTGAEAWRKLVNRLDLWENDGGLPGSQYAIPGYHTPPRRMASNRLPAGWSVDNFVRLAPSQAERALTAQGKKAYSAFQPGVHTTRVGIAPGQLVFFDDEQQDLHVNFMGSNKPAVRPLAFHALDCGSGCNVMRNFKPMLTLETGKKRTLEQADFYWFSVAYLTQIGWRKDTGTEFVGERGTAAWEEDFQKAVHGVTGGLVSFDKSGVFRDPAFRGALFEGKSCGNSRFKAPIESGFNGIRNRFAHLPGATGRNRDEAPEEAYGMDKYNSWLLKLIKELPVERAMLLRMPLLEWHSYVMLAHDILEAMNRRTEHDLEGWARSGYTCPVIHVAGKDLRLTKEVMAKASPEDLMVFDTFVKMGMGRIEAMSPREVWTQHYDPKIFRTLRDWEVGTLMGVKFARLVTVTKQLTVEIDDQEIDPDTLRYLAQVRDADGTTRQLERGEKYLAWLNPYAPDKLQIGSARAGHEGKWLGTAPIMARACRTDADTLVRTYSRIQQATAGERQMIEQQVSSTLAQRTADYQWNKRIADLSKPLTPGERENAVRAEEAAAALPLPESPARQKARLPDPFDSP